MTEVFQITALIIAIFVTIPKDDTTAMDKCLENNTVEVCQSTLKEVM